VSIVRLAEHRRERPSIVTLDRVLEARDRIAPYIRYTPLLKARLRCTDGRPIDVSMKLENLQVAETFEVRGVINAALEQPYERVARGLVGYGSRHGAAIAYAGHLLEVPTTVYMPDLDGPTSFAPTLEAWGATIIRAGRTRDDALRLALQHASDEELFFIHPWANPSMLAGCATLVLELVEAMPDIDMLVTHLSDHATLLAGIAAVAKQIRPRIRLVGVDHSLSTRRAGASSAARRPNSGRVLGRQQPVAMHRQVIEQFVDEIVIVTQAEVTQTASMLWSELEIRSGSFSASAIAAILTGKVDCSLGKQIGAVITTGGGRGIF
jgi:threonine dehydratase